MIGDRVIAGARADRVDAAAAIDRIRTGPGRDVVRCGGTSDGDSARQNACIQIFKIGNGDGVARRLVAARRDGEIDRCDPA